MKIRKTIILSVVLIWMLLIPTAMAWGPQDKGQE